MVLEEFMGVPVHPLLVHVPVVLVPTLALLVAAYALVPLLRPHTRWVLGVLAVVAPIGAVLAKLSGDEFFDRGLARGDITEGFVPTIENHQQLGTNTMWATLALGVVTLALVYAIGSRGEKDSVVDWVRGRRFPPLVLGALAIIAAAVSLYFVIRTGDSGSKAVWEGR